MHRGEAQPLKRAPSSTHISCKKRHSLDPFCDIVLQCDAQRRGAASTESLKLDTYIINKEA